MTYDLRRMAFFYNPNIMSVKYLQLFQEITGKIRIWGYEAGNWRGEGNAVEENFTVWE